MSVRDPFPVTSQLPPRTSQYPPNQGFCSETPAAEVPQIPPGDPPPDPLTSQPDPASELPSGHLQATSRATSQAHLSRAGAHLSGGGASSTFHMTGVPGQLPQINSLLSLKSSVFGDGPSSGKKTVEEQQGVQSEQAPASAHKWTVHLTPDIRHLTVSPLERDTDVWHRHTERKQTRKPRKLDCEKHGADTETCPVNRSPLVTSGDIRPGSIQQHA